MQISFRAAPIFIPGRGILVDDGNSKPTDDTLSRQKPAEKPNVSQEDLDKINVMLKKAERKIPKNGK